MFLFSVFLLAQKEAPKKGRTQAQDVEEREACIVGAYFFQGTPPHLRGLGGNIKQRIDAVLLSTGLSIVSAEHRCPFRSVCLNLVLTSLFIVQALPNCFNLKT